MRRVKATYRVHRLSRFLRHTTLKRLTNLVLSHTQYKLGIGRIYGISPLVYIDPVNICNLRCPLCPTGRRSLGRDWGRMPFDLYKTVIDEIADKVYFVNLYNWGEPLLHPQLFDMIEYATQKGLSVRISANLNQMKPEQARLMVESGLEDLLVDVDGAEQQSYEKYRVGGRLDRVLENICEIVQVKRDLNSPFPLITVRTLMNRYNQSELHEIQTLVLNMGVDRYEAVPIYVDSRNPEDLDEWLPSTAQRPSPYRPEKPRKCVYLWRNLTISWDGGVFPCCWFHEKEYDFGSVLQEGGVLRVLNNEKFVQSRRFVAGKTDVAPDTICAKCKGYPELYYSYSDGD